MKITIWNTKIKIFNKQANLKVAQNLISRNRTKPQNKGLKKGLKNSKLLRSFLIAKRC